MADGEAWSRSEIRRRPGMWVGSTGSFGLMVLTLEVVENMVDQALAGRATSLYVNCRSDGSIEVADDGSGLDLSDGTVRSFFEVAHDKATADGHVPHIHLWGPGLGLFVVTALCERVVVDSVCAGVRRVHEWSDGGESHQVVSVEEVSDSPSGTSIRFWPDRSIFVDASPDLVKLARRIDELDCLLPELVDVQFITERVSAASRDGLIDLMKLRLRAVDRVWRYSSAAGDGTTAVDMAISSVNAHLEPSHRLSEQMLLFCNFREVTEESGVHGAIREALGGMKETPIRGLILACSLRMLDPQFSGPTKGRMDDPAAAMHLRKAVEELLSQNPDAASVVRRLIQI